MCMSNEFLQIYLCEGVCASTFAYLCMYVCMGKFVARVNMYTCILACTSRIPVHICVYVCKCLLNVQDTDSCVLYAVADQL